MTKKKIKRYGICYACIPDFLEPYAILPEDVGDYDQAKLSKILYKERGIKSKIIKVEILEVLK